MEAIGLTSDWNALDWPLNPLDDFTTSFAEPLGLGSAVEGATQSSHVLFDSHLLSALEARWMMKESCWQSLHREMSGLAVEIPTRIAMSRYIQSYFEHFHRHFPMIHAPTWSPETSLPALTLIIAALGATYRFEVRNGPILYHAARKLLLSDLTARNDAPDNTASGGSSLEVL